VPVIAHVHAKVPRHAVEQGIGGAEPLANGLPEFKGGQQRVQPSEDVIAQALDGLIERERIARAWRELRPERAFVIDFEAARSL
jgi:hypothetical protein